MFHLIAFGLCLAMYFLPSILAHQKHNFAAIFLVNLFLGWTVIGWIVALIWAMTTPAPVPVYAQPNCSVCRAPIHAGQNFCPGCGRPLAWPGGTRVSGT